MEGVCVALSELIALRRFAKNVSYQPIGLALRPGQHLSKLRGRGIDFSEARNYQAGDEIKHMEWRVTARTGKPHVKVYHEEQERPVVIVVDFNPSMYFGTKICFKSVIAARLAAIIAWTAAKQGDRVGGFCFSGKDHNEFVPRARQAGVLPILASLVKYTENYAQNANLEPEKLSHALLRVRRVAKPGSVIVLISDFYNIDKDFDRELNNLRNHNDILTYQICDKLELAPPHPDKYAISDGIESLNLDTSIDSIRFGYQFYCEERITLLQAKLSRLEIQCIQVSSDLDLPLLVRQTFPRRKRG
jgi:hypothetical protein